MTKVCTHGRGKREAMRQLEQSLRRLQTDHLDLWQIHECVYDNDPDLHFARGGVIEALDQAKRQGKVRFVGFTGHKHPDIHLAMLTHDLRLRHLPASAQLLRRDVPLVRAAGAAGAACGAASPPIGMKSLGGDGRQVKEKVVTAEEALRYAMSLPVATTVSGIDSMKVLRQNLRVAHGFKPMSKRQMDALRKRVRDGGGRRPLRAVQDHRDARRQGGPQAARVPERRGTCCLNQLATPTPNAQRESFGS